MAGLVSFHARARTFASRSARPLDVPDIDEVLFAPNIRDLPVVSADPYLNQLLIRYCEEALARRSAKRSPFRSSVENAIVPLLPHGKARADVISRRLGVSPPDIGASALVRANKL